MTEYKLLPKDSPFEGCMFLAVAYPDVDSGFVVEAVSVPGVISQGDTLEECWANIAEAYELMLVTCEERDERIPVSLAKIDQFPKDAVRQLIQL